MRIQMLLLQSHQKKWWLNSFGYFFSKGCFYDDVIDVVEHDFYNQ